jgi:hypothetical protein
MVLLRRISFQAKPFCGSLCRREKTAPSGFAVSYLINDLIPGIDQKEFITAVA